MGPGEKRQSLECGVFLLQTPDSTYPLFPWEKFPIPLVKIPGARNRDDPSGDATDPSRDVTDHSCDATDPSRDETDPSR